MRRFLLLVLGTAIAVSGCGGSKGWPDQSSAPSQAPTATATATAAPTATPTAKPSPTKTPKASPTTAGASDADWVLVEPDGMGFTSMWPGEPTKTTSSSKISAGTVATTLWTYEDGTDLAYFVAVVKYPKGALAGQTASKVYDNAIKGMLTSTGTTLTIKDSGDVTVNGHLGRGTTLTSSEYNVQVALLLVGNTLYMVYIVYRPVVTDLSEPELFFSDFNLTV
jgi:hypothetical protein